MTLCYVEVSVWLHIKELLHAVVTPVVTSTCLNTSTWPGDVLVMRSGVVVLVCHHHRDYIWFSFTYGCDILNNEDESVLSSLALCWLTSHSLLRMDSVRWVCVALLSQVISASMT